MATPQQIASQAGSANTAYQMQAAHQSYGRKRKKMQSLGAYGENDLVQSRQPRQSQQLRQSRQENQALNGLQTTRRQRLENQAVQKLNGRARRKKGGNYTAYGQTGGTLAPNALAPGRNPKAKHHGGGGLVYTPDGTFRMPREPKPGITSGDNFGRGNSHGVAIVRGDGVFGGSHSLQNDLYAPSGARRKKNGSNGKGGLYVAPRKKGRRRGRPQYTHTTIPFNPNGKQLHY